jgi:CRISPR-associated protein Cst1
MSSINLMEKRFEKEESINGSELYWTGNPFVDAGLAAIAAIVGVKKLEELTVEHLEEATRELERIMLSDQALGIGVKKSFARSALSQIFPNSELVNPSNWKGKTPEERVENVRTKFQEALKSDLEQAKISFIQSGNFTCFVCGRKTPKEAMTFVRKDKMPLLVGIVNFYPAFSFGLQVCGLCAFAVRFLPMSVMRTGVSNRLWFLHTQALEVVTEISRSYCWTKFNEAIAANEPLEFYSQWQTAGDAGTVLYVICELLERFGEQLRETYLHPLPTTAYLFSNDNRNPYVQPLPIPNELLIFLAKLQLKSQHAFQRFWRELLLLPDGLNEKERKIRIRFVQKVAQGLLNGESIIGVCLDEGNEQENRPPRLWGGWPGHVFYLREVRKMSESKLAILERLGLSIAQIEDAKKRIMELRKAERGDLYTIFLRYVREGWLKHDEFYTLLPPNSDIHASELRDILLAVIYEWQHCQQKGEEFSKVAEKVTLSPDETLKRIEQIGEHLCQKLPNLPRWIGQLQTARSTERIRGVYLLAVQRGALSFSDFVFLAPLGDRHKIWLLRDYLLAFLFERAREVLSEEEEIVPEEVAIEKI